jgi:hypothetical protein
MTTSLDLRIGGVGAGGGGALVLVGNILHPRESGQLDDAEALLTVAADSDIWVADHLVITAGIGLLLAGFYGLRQSISGPGVTWAGLGWGAAIVGVATGLAFMMTEAIAVASLADDWATSSGADKVQALAAGDAIFQLSLTLAAAAALILFGVTPILYGLAILGSDDYRAALGWIGVVAGSVTFFASVIQVFTGITTLTGLILVPLGIVVVTVWQVYLGVVMWRRSTSVGAGVSLPAG